MPNWVSITLTVDGPHEDLYEFYTGIPALALKGKETSILKSFIPEPEDPDIDHLMWQLDNWGVKWGDRDTECRELFHSDDMAHTTAVFNFSTPWHFPLVGFMTITSMFPTLRFQFEIHEECGLFAGFIVMRNGHHLFGHTFSDDDWDGPLETDDDWDEFDSWKRSRLGELCDDAEQVGWEGMEDRKPAPFGYGPDEVGPF